MYTSLIALLPLLATAISASPISRRQGPPDRPEQQIRLRRQQDGSDLCVTMDRTVGVPYTAGSPILALDCSNAVYWRIIKENNLVSAGDYDMTAVDYPNNNGQVQAQLYTGETLGQRWIFQDDGHIAIGNGDQCLDIGVDGQLQTYACQDANPNQREFEL